MYVERYAKRFGINYTQIDENFIYELYVGYARSVFAK